MSRQSFVGADVSDFPPSSHTAVANTVTRTNLWVPGIWTPIPAMDARAGKAYQLRCGGIISATASPTIIFNPTSSSYRHEKSVSRHANWFVDPHSRVTRLGISPHT
jgi:hypothetical protein